MGLDSNIIGVDAGTICCTDLGRAIAVVPEKPELYQALFGTPIRRARQLGAGIGFVVDCGDDTYDIEVRIGAEADCGPKEKVHVLHFSANDIWLTVSSGIITVCDGLCLLKPASKVLEELDPTHSTQVKVAPGVYKVTVTGFGRVANVDEEGRGAYLFSNEDHATLSAAYREKLSQRMSEDTYSALVAAVLQRSVRVINVVAYDFVAATGMPPGYDPDEVKLEIPRKQIAIVKLAVKP